MKWQRFIYPRPNAFLKLDFFINPLPVVTVLAMGLNDHVLKYEFTSWLTGKLSDFLGMFCFPLFLCALVTVATGRYLTKISLVISILISAALLISVKISSSLTAQVESLFSHYFFAIQLTTDPTDLLALMVLPLTYCYGKHFIDFHHQSRHP